MLHNKCKKILIIIVAIVFLFGNAKVFAETSLRDYRENLVSQMRKNTKISHQKKKSNYKTEHFYVYIDNRSIEGFNLEYEEEKIERLMLRICFLLEETYQLVGESFGQFPKTKFSVSCYSPRVYKFARNENYTFLVSGGGKLKMLVPEDLMSDPFDDFSEGISQLYYAYARLYLYAIAGPGFYNKASEEISSYFQKIGEKTSRWKQDFTEEERKEIIKSIDQEHSFLFKKYPRYFKNKDVNKKTMTCKWCKKEVDVTGKREGQRILCPHCRSPIFVE